MTDQPFIDKYNEMLLEVTRLELEIRDLKKRENHNSIIGALVGALTLAVIIGGLQTFGIKI